MPSRKPRTPSYRLHRPTGQAVVTLSGRDVYLGQHGTQESRDAYDRAVAGWLANARRAPEPQPTPLSINELLLGYMRWAESYYRGRPGECNKDLHHMRRAVRSLRRLFGMTAAADFGPRKLELVRDSFVADGLCRSTVNRYTRRVRHVFRWGVTQELVPAPVWQALAALEGLRRGHTDAHEPEPIRSVPDVLVDAIRPHVSRQVWGLIQFQRYTGARPGEACIIRPIDLDMSGPLWTYKPARHKTEHLGRERVIMIGPKGQQVLWPFLKRDTQAYLFSAAESDQERRAEVGRHRKTPLHYGNRPGTHRKRRPAKQPQARYSVDSYRRAIEYGCDRAFPPPAPLTRLPRENKAAWRARLVRDGQVDDLHAWQQEHRWHPNQLRHTFGTRVRKEFGLDGAQAALGHAEADVTQIYAEKNQELAARVAAKLG